MTKKVQSLVGPSDIAELAQVTRGAVSNWRKRSKDFPESVGGTISNPLFSLDEVLAWLRERGQRVTAGVEEALWGALNALRGEFSADEIAQLTLTLACAMKTSQGRLESDLAISELMEVLRESASAMAQQALLPEDSMEHAIRVGAEKLVPTISALADIPQANRAEVIDSILERISRTQIKLGTTIGFVESKVSETLAALADLQLTASTFYDPACGIASALVDIGIRRRGARLYAQEISEPQALIARQRAYLRDLDLDVRAGDTLADDLFPDTRFDVVVLDPPYGSRFDDDAAIADARYTFGIPPRSSADFAWIQHAIAHLTDDGVAFVVTPMGALERSGSERGIREALLRDGCIRAIVGLPEKMNPQTSIRLALWVLQRPTARVDDVLLIDAYKHPSPQKDVARWLQQDGTEIPVPHRSVNVMDLLKDDANLTPHRWVEFEDSSPEAVLASFRDATSAIREALAVVPSLVQEVEATEAAQSPRVVTVAELVEQGVVEIWQSRAKPRSRDDRTADVGQADVGVITTGNIRSGVLPDAPSINGFNIGPAELTQAGDVLIITWNNISAVLDEEGGRPIGQGVYRIRVRRPSIVSPAYLAAVIAGSWNSRFVGGTTIQRAHPKDLEVPLIPIEAQNDFMKKFSSAHKLRMEAASIERNAAQAESTLLDATRYGVDLSGQAQGRP